VVPAAPPKLGKKTVKAAKGGDCGAFDWTVQWVLDKPSPSGGWVVQRVDGTRDVKDSAGRPADGSWDATGWCPYWEAWQINRGQRITTYAEKNDVDDDRYWVTTPARGTKGSVTITGSAEFYEGLALPSSFKVTNKPPAWILPYTKTAPLLAGGTGAIPHTLTATWDCCTGSDHTTKVTVG
jgi:hypothetical protein